MPVKSKKQFGLMEAAAHGNLKSAGGPSAGVAKEFLSKTPEKKKKAFAHSLMHKKSGSGMMEVNERNVICFSLTLTETQLTTLLTSLMNQGISINQNSTNGIKTFLIDGHGIEASAAYAGINLNVEIKNKPFFVSIAHIQEALVEAINAQKV